jgi:hypothetical protein
VFTFAGVFLHFVTTNRPWELGFEALVVSVNGPSLGLLAEDVKHQFPTADWDSLAFHPPTVDTPVVLPTGASGSSSSVHTVVCVTLHDDVSNQVLYLPSTSRNIARAVSAALRRAETSGARRVALPLIGTGANGLGMSNSAEATLAGIYDYLRTTVSRLDFIAIVGTSAATSAALGAWQVYRTNEGEEQIPASTADDFYPPLVGQSDLPALSPTAIVNLQRIVQLASLSTPSVVDGDAVLLNFYDRGTELFYGIAGFVSEALRARVVGLDRDKLLPPVPDSSFKKASVNRVLSYPGVRQLLAVAEGVRRSVGIDSEIRSRHLLAAAVDQGISDALLRQLNISPFGARVLVYSAITQALGAQSHEQWHIVLEVEPGITLADRRTFWEAPTDLEIEIYDGLGGGTSSDAVDARKSIPLAQDSLDVGDYASMLGAIIARKSTPVPLSVGLFGEWGSGKSYFMGLLRSEVDKYGTEDNETYYSEVVQIGFNAWSYADSNLWASLGDEIFGHLAGREALADDDDLERRKQIREEIANHGTRAVELQDERTQADEHVRGLESRRQVELGKVLEAVGRSPEAQGILDRAWKRMGVSDDSTKVRVLMEDSASLIGSTRYLRSALTPAALWILVIGVGAALGSVSVGLFFGGADAVRAGIGLALSALALALPASMVVLHVTSRAMGALAGVVRKVQEGNEAEIALAVTKVRVLDQEIADSVRRVRDLNNELAQLSPGNRLYSFLADRVSSEDYRGQLGLISTIRRDLETFARLQTRWKKQRIEQQAEGAEGQPTPIDRIVLYIDDLDRCAPEQVMVVLEAVHLLLATELFVVVVGVDPLWLVQALRRRHVSAFDPNAIGATGEKELGLAPEDYLEKIFNIPFRLPPMTHDSFGSLIRDVAKAEGLPSGAVASAGSADNVPPNDHDLAVMEPDPVPNDDNQRPNSLRGADVSATDDLLSPAGLDGAPEVANKSRTDPARARWRPITPPELAMLERLSVFVRSPRQAKRVINIYRMLRSTQSLSAGSSFLKPGTAEGDYQAVVLLLGVLSAKPYLLTAFLWAPATEVCVGGLYGRDEFSGWDAIIEGMYSHQISESGVWANDFLPGMTRSTSLEWDELAGSLRHLSPHLSMPDLEAVRRWGRHVARFSFVE